MGHQYDLVHRYSHILNKYISVIVIFDDICIPKILYTPVSGIQQSVVGFNASPRSITCQGEEFPKKERKKR
jgi:hypothetical protein